jgi:hypothetical protein
MMRSIWLTIGTVANKGAPSPIRTLHEPDFDFHPSHRKTALLRIDLTLEGLEHQTFVAVSVRKLK